MTELRACPYCGNTQGNGLGVRPGTDFVYCQCGAQKPERGWNLRPIEDAQAAEIDKKDAEIERLNAALDEIERFDFWNDLVSWEDMTIRLKDIARAAREREVEG